MGKARRGIKISHTEVIQVQIFKSSPELQES